MEEEEEEFEYPAPLVCERWSEIHCEKGIKARAEQSGVRLIVFWFLKSYQNQKLGVPEKKDE